MAFTISVMYCLWCSPFGHFGYIYFTLEFFSLRKASTRPKSDTMTYGWKRVEILGAVMNATFLLALCFYIVLESIPRFIQPPSVQSRNSTNVNEHGNSSFINGTQECNSESVNGDWWYLGTAIAILCVNVFSAIVFAGMASPLLIHNLFSNWDTWTLSWAFSRRWAFPWSWVSQFSRFSWFSWLTWFSQFSWFKAWWKGMQLHEFCVNNRNMDIMKNILTRKIIVGNEHLILIWKWSFFTNLVILFHHSSCYSPPFYYISFLNKGGLCI